MAGLAFIPFLGFFLGSIAVTWGLVSGRPGARRAVAIAATGALLNAAAAVLLIGTKGAGNAALQDGYRGAIEQSLGDVVQALEEHRGTAHSYPESLQALQRARGPLHAVPILDLGAGLFRIPRAYQYVLAPDGLSYDLFSVGPDGKPYTRDDVRPAVPESLRSRTGLRPAGAGLHQ